MTYKAYKELQKDRKEKRDLMNSGYYKAAYPKGQTVKVKQKRGKTLYQITKADTWKLFSMYIRLRDCRKTTGTLTNGICVTCGRPYDYKQLQAGHCFAGRGNSILFNEEATHAQCRQCNIFKNGNYTEYRNKINAMYPVGTYEKLEILNKQNMPFDIPYLRAKQKELKEKIKELHEGRKSEGIKRIFERRINAN